MDTLNGFGIQALFCSNGIGDPAHPGKATSARHTLANAVASGLPVMGICLGHQLMGLASGLKTYKMRYGHRGANQPVVDLKTRRVWITSQNHGFAVADPEHGMLAAHPSGATSPEGENLHGYDVEVRYINANDKTVEGLDVLGRPCFTVQFHPEACPGTLTMQSHCSTDSERWLTNTFEVMHDAEKRRPQYHPRAWFRANQDRTGR